MQIWWRLREDVEGKLYYTKRFEGRRRYEEYNKNNRTNDKQKVERDAMHNI